MDFELLKLLETVGFPVWALVVAAAAVYISKEIRSLRNEYSVEMRSFRAWIQEYMMRMENRVSKLEAIIQYKHRHSDHLEKPDDH